MKKDTDPRHIKRIKIVKELFAYSFSDSNTLGKSALDIHQQVNKLDKIISDSAPAWPIEKINRIDLAILRLAVYELTTTDTPKKVVIDEAVELAKRYGGENSPSFVNGVLGKIVGKDKK